MNWGLQVRQHLQQRYTGLSRAKKILVWCLLVWLVWQGYRWIHRTPFMPQEIATVEQLTQPAQTVCLGRFLLDIPTSQVSKLSGTYDIDGMRLKVLKVGATQKEFEAMFYQFTQEEEVKKKRSSPLSDRETYTLNDMGIGMALTWRKTLNLADVIYFETFVWKLIDDVVVRLTFDASKADYNQEFPRLQHLLTRLERMPRDGSLPQGSGFCAGAVFVKGTEAVQEEMNVNFELAVPHDDAYIALSTNTSEASKTGLLARAAKNTALYAQSGFRYTTLRSGEKKIQDLKGEELLAKAPINDNGGISQKLVWEHQPEKASVLKPQIKFEMNTGNNENNNTSYTDAIAVGIYDRILGTLRLRPGQQ